MLKLFISPGACSRASHIALEESGLPYEAIRVNLAQGEQTRPDYLRINPKGRVPALVTERGVLTENVAILPYIAQIAPQAKLAPLDDPFAFAAMQAFNAYLSSTVHVAHAHKMRGTRWASEPTSLEDMKRKVPETMAACFTLIENELLEGPWALGEAYSVADAYLFTIAGWLEGDGVDMARFPKVADHFRRMNERPAVQRVLAAEKA